MLAVFSTARPPLAGAGAGLPACATETPSTVKAAREMPATARPAPGRPVCSRLARAAGPAWWPRAAGAAARAARAAKPATSMIPATTPAVVRISVNPNSPVHTDSRYPPRVARANPAPAAAIRRLPAASTAAARANAVITWSRNSQPTVGIDRYPVRYRSRWIAPVAASSPAPATRRPSRWSERDDWAVSHRLGGAPHLPAGQAGRARREDAL